MTTDTGMKALKALIGEFEALDEYLKAVREVLQGGHMPDLAGLDERVSMLCGAVQKAAPEIQQRCLPKLDELLHKLDICEEEVRLFHAEANKSVRQ